MQIKYKFVKVPDKYVANDGSEFDTELECFDYEARNSFSSAQVKNIESKIQKIKFLFDLDDEELQDYPVMFVSNEDDLVNLAQYFISAKGCDPVSVAMLINKDPSSSKYQQTLIGHYITWRFFDWCDSLDLRIKTVDGIYDELMKQKNYFEVSMDNIRLELE